jgi:hypothetical protein
MFWRPNVPLNGNSESLWEKKSIFLSCSTSILRIQNLYFLWTVSPQYYENYLWLLEIKYSNTCLSSNWLKTRCKRRSSSCSWAIFVYVCAQRRYILIIESKCSDDWLFKPLKKFYRINKIQFIFNKYIFHILP